MRKRRRWSCQSEPDGRISVEKVRKQERSCGICAGAPVFCIDFDHAQPAEDTAIPRGEEARRDGRDAAQACPLCSVDRRRGGIFHFSWNHWVACLKRNRASRRQKNSDCIRYLRTVRKHVSGNFSREELWPSGEKMRQCLPCRCEPFGLRAWQSAEIKKTTEVWFGGFLCVIPPGWASAGWVSAPAGGSSHIPAWWKAGWIAKSWRW